jgi:hypothetical protein
MDTLGNMTIQEIIAKVNKCEKLRLNHNKNMKTYRENHLEHAKEYSCKKAKEYYWRKKGFTINENGEKVPIQETLGVSQ